MKTKIILFGLVMLVGNCMFYFAGVFSDKYIQKPDYSNCTKSELAMSVDIVPYFESFITDCEKNNIKYDHAYCLNWMRFTHHCSFQGQTDYDDKTIQINGQLILDTIGLKFVIYHELGHWMGLGHGEGIMKESYGSEDREWARKNWNELLRDYFDKIKNN